MGRKVVKVLLACPPAHPVTHSKRERRYWKAYLGLRSRTTFWRLDDSQLAVIGNNEHQHVGPLSIGNTLKKARHSVDYFAPLYDGIAPEKREEHYTTLFRERIRDQSPDVVGFSTHSCNVKTAMEWSRIARENGIVTVLGGSHASGVLGEDRADAASKFDFLIRGAGEIPMSILCNKLADGINPALEMNPGVPGLVFNVPDTSTLLALMMDETRVFPEPDNSFMYADSIPAARVYSQLGCGHHCSFCADRILNWGDIKRDLKLVEREILSLHEKFGTVYIYMGNQNIFRNKVHSLALLDMLRRFNSYISFGFQGNISDFDREIIEAIARLDARTEIQYGIESVDPEVLKKARKGSTIAKTEEVLRTTKELGLIVSGNWLIGLPGSTAESDAKLIEVMIQLSEDGLLDFSELRTAVVAPGSLIYANPEKYGVEILGRDWENYRGECVPQFRLRELSAEQMYGIYLDGLDKLAGIYENRLDKTLVTALGSRPEVTEGLF